MACSLCQNPRLPWSIALHAYGASFPSNRLVFNEIVAYQEQAWATTAMTKETTKYRKIPKISPGAYVFQRPFLRGLFFEGLIFGGAYLRREIDWGSLIVEGWVEGKFTVYALFYFVIEGNFPSTSRRGGLYLVRRFNGCVTGLGGLFSEFYGNSSNNNNNNLS